MPSEVLIMIKRFNEINGLFPTKIIGQDRLAYAFTEHEDIYELKEIAEHSGYRGSVILFYDFETGNVYRPFEKIRNVIYGRPVYTENAYYFLGADYDRKRLSLFRYLPGCNAEEVKDFNLDEVDLYNISIIGEGLHIVSQGKDTFNSYYPERFSFRLEPNESVDFIDNDKIYIEAWVEEGWDDVRNCATDDYRFYDKVIVKDKNGNTLSEETGSIYQDQNGTRWIC